MNRPRSILPHWRVIAGWLRPTANTFVNPAASDFRSGWIKKRFLAFRVAVRYAQESSWREDNRRQSNREQVNRIASLAMKRGKSVDFAGYWQRHISE